MEALDYFYRYYASSVVARRDDGLYTQDPLNGYIIEADRDSSRVVDILNAFLKAMGMWLEVEYYDVDPIIDDEVYDLGVDIPDYIKDMFDKDN